MITKTSLIESIKTLPEEFTIDELIERLIVVQKIEEGQRQSRAGKTNTTEGAKQKLKKWLQ